MKKVNNVAKPKKVQVRFEIEPEVWAEIRAEAVRRRCRTSEVAKEILRWAVRKGWQHWKRGVEEKGIQG